MVSKSYKIFIECSQRIKFFSQTKLLGMRMSEKRLRLSGNFCLNGIHLLPANVSIESRMTVRPRASVVSPPATSKFLPMTINPGNLRPSLVRPRLIHLELLRSKNSTRFRAGSASEAPPATMTPSLPLTLALTHECCNDHMVVLGRQSMMIQGALLRAPFNKAESIGVYVILQ